MGSLKKIEKFHDELTLWRRDIHAHPELGFEENRTADLVAEKLSSFGIDVYRGLGNRCCRNLACRQQSNGYWFTR